MNKRFFLGGLLLFLSGCVGIGIQNDTPPSLFIPKDNSFSASLSNTSSSKDIDKKENISVLERDNEKYFLITQKNSPSGMYEFRLYSTDNNSCGIHAGKCIFEVWENYKDTKSSEKIFFFEEKESGQLSSYYKGSPIAWRGDKNIIFLKQDEKKTSFRSFLSAFNPFTQEVFPLYKLVFWKDVSTQKKDGLITITQNGNQYFLDPLSYKGQFKAYKVLDLHKPFYVRSSGLENLSFIDTLPESGNFELTWEEKFEDNKIFFRVTKEDKSVIYEFTGKGGFKRYK